jgi:hypothetical protein
VSGRTLIVPPFRIQRHGLSYTSPAELRIDLAALRPAAYRVVAVHNFHVEDCNPSLEECTAAVFLAARLPGGWEEPEAFPVECRTLEILGHVQVT